MWNKFWSLREAVCLSSAKYGKKGFFIWAQNTRVKDILFETHINKPLASFFSIPWGRSSPAYRYWNTSIYFKENNCFVDCRSKSILFKRQKFGMILFKLCWRKKYTYNFSVYCGKQSSPGVSVLSMSCHFWRTY